MGCWPTIKGVFITKRRVCGQWRPECARNLKVRSRVTYGSGCSRRAHWAGFALDGGKREA